MELRGTLTNRRLAGGRLAGRSLAARRLAADKPYIDEMRRRRARVFDAKTEQVLALAGDNLWDEIDLNEIPSDHEKSHAALLTDLKRTGLLEDTLVIWGAEFGRTPVSQKGGRGRDHNATAFTMWMAGGGVKGGETVGTTDEIESEGFDRTDLKLPGRQNELVSAVAAANPHTVVVVNAGAPVEMPWRAEVPAVLWAWLPGQEGGSAC